MQKWIIKVWEWIKFAFWWFIDLFRERYEVTVSFNRGYGDADDKKYIAKKLINKPNREGIEYLPFWWLIVMKIISILPKSIISKL